MALSASTLSAAIKAGLLSNDDAGAQDNVALTALCDEIATAVVDCVVADAVVNVAGAVTATDPISGPLPLVGTGTIS